MTQMSKTPAEIADEVLHAWAIGGDLEPILTKEIEAYGREKWNEALETVAQEFQSYGDAEDIGISLAILNFKQETP